jgi:hypothetical protein
LSEWNLVLPWNTNGIDYFFSRNAPVSHSNIINIMDHFWNCNSDGPSRFGINSNGSPIALKSYIHHFTVPNEETTFLSFAIKSLDVKPFLNKYWITALTTIMSTWQSHVTCLLYYIQSNIICMNDLMIFCFVYSRTSNFSAIWRLSPLPVTGLQILAYARRSGPLSREGSLLCHPTATRDLGLYGLIRKTGTHNPQWDSNPRRKDNQIIAPDALTTDICLCVQGFIVGLKK